MAIRDTQFWSSRTRQRKVHDHPLKPNKIPYPLRVHGSVIARVWPQVFIIGVFSTGITCISELGHKVNFGIQTTMISTLGFIVGLALSFRTSTAYANWKEGRSQWDRLAALSRNLARIIWIHGPDDNSTIDLLRKKSALNLIAAFGVALKHHLREERGHEARDVRDLIGNLTTYSMLRKHSTTPADMSKRRCHAMFEPEERDTTSNNTVAYGCLPVEIAFHLASYMEYLKAERGMDLQSFGYSIQQTNGLMDVISACERILRDPVPVAYNIVISQLVWVFMLFLPFQLQSTLHWISIPATIVTGAMLFGLAEIGLEIENPWGDDANDLDTDNYAQNLVLEFDTLTTLPPVKPNDWIMSQNNTPLFPSSDMTFDQLKDIPRDELQQLMKSKALEVKYNDVLRPRTLLEVIKQNKQRHDPSNLELADRCCPAHGRPAGIPEDHLTGKGGFPMVNVYDAGSSPTRADHHMMV